MRRPHVLVLASLIITGIFLIAPAGPPPVTFTDGVASGDITPFSAVLWTRVDRQAVLTVDVSTDPSFPHTATLRRKLFASSQDDFTVNTLVGPLKPDQTYFYRFHRGGSVSDTGSFTTAPLAMAAADLRFAYSGDSDGTQVDDTRPHGDFEVLDAARGEDLDFFVYLGDTIYSDSDLRDAGPAQTLDEYRDAYKVNREVAALRDLLADTSIYAMWDDHEVHNDFDGQTVDAARFANGHEAFLEYMPIRERRLLHDADCAGDPLFRRFRWGSDVDVIILDERSCRSADAEPACLVELAPGEFAPDLAPTMPRPLRQALGSILPDDLKPILLPDPPDGCLDTVHDPSRTMLGEVQKRRLKQALLHSDARFKFIINEVPIQQFYALPYDRWEGYAAERDEILSFIRDREIEGVIFLTTDTHANFMNQVFIDRFAAPEPIAEEFVTGPIATNTFESEIRSFFGGGPLDELGVLAFNQILNIVGVDCRDLDAFSYGLVEVDAEAGTATITFKDQTGAVLHDQIDASIPCTRTIGP